MSTIEKDWVPLSESVIPDLFNTDYKGNFANNLVVNTPRLKRFLDIASLDGRVLLTDSPPTRAQPPANMNSDGSLGLSVDPLSTLRLGKPRSVTNALMLQPERLGWRMSISDDVITEEVKKKNNGQYRGIEQEFARKFNSHFTRGLEVALIRDKLTTDKDPALYSRLIGTAIMSYNYVWLATHSVDYLHQDALHGIMTNITLFTAGVILIPRLIHYQYPFLNQDDSALDIIASPLLRSFIKSISFDRRTLKSRLEIPALPVELDRVILADAYLQWQRLNQRPFIALAR